MNVLQHIASATKRLGYRVDAIQYDYGFPDLAAGPHVVKRAAMAVFTQTPASYRSAAFGVVHAGAHEPGEVADEHRALGAPLFFVIEQNNVSVWQVFGTGPARMLERTDLGGLDALFDSHQTTWSPDAIHRAKSIGKFDPAYQLDFVDAGLLPAIEGHIHRKLDRLLNDVLVSIRTGKPGSPDEHRTFQAVFRLLAAKILMDRQHATALKWDPENVGSVLAGIGEYYSLPHEVNFKNAIDAKQFEGAWSILRDGLNVANISADDLAYVYENTLVTPQTRQTFGTHSTPRQVAEFVAARLRLWHPESSALRVYEPFTGAGVLLVAALRHMRGALPAEWTDRKRHTHLVKQLRGSEIDAFACEVATLSLILADYPNTNGWKIDNADLFDGNHLASELNAADVILCNPPFEALTEAEKRRYPQFAAVGGNKAEAVLKLAIQSSPIALGFVLPRAFLMDRAYSWHRKEIESRYGDIEVVSLPDGVFRESKVESALLIARNPVRAGNAQRLRSSEVDDQDRKAFLAMGTPSREREEERITSLVPAGNLWLPRLGELWKRLSAAPTLGRLLEAHWGIRWKDRRQRTAASERPAVDRARGLLRATDHRQFCLGKTSWLDVCPDHLYGAGDLPWERPKILCNAGRSSRGVWRIAAAVDREGLVASQQFVALWPKVDGVDLDALAAVINGPLANAYMSQFSADRRLRIGTLLSLPLPMVIPQEVGDLAREYAHFIHSDRNVLGGREVLQHMLDRIDALVLDAYGLPPRMVRSLLAEFDDEKRPLAHAWQSWNVSESDPALTLSELRSAWVRDSRGNWLQGELPPIPEREGQLIAEVMD